MRPLFAYEHGTCAYSGGILSVIEIYRESTAVPLSLWIWNVPFRKDLCDGMGDKTWSPVPLFAHHKHDGEKESRQRSKECFGNRETIECSQPLAGQNESGIRHCYRPKNCANQVHRDSSPLNIATIRSFAVGKSYWGTGSLPSPRVL